MEPVGMNRALSLAGISAYADIVREIAEGRLLVLTLKSARRRRGLAGGRPRSLWSAESVR